METISAKEALERLKQGNQRLLNGEAKGPGQFSEQRREELTQKARAGQAPYAIILSCADSRVPVELLFDAGSGELFVVRVAGNVANTSTIASIEYAVAHLGTKLVVVMAHETCGAVAAAIAGGDAGKNLNTLIGYIQPVVGSGDDTVDEVSRRNARQSADRLLNESDIIRTAVESGDVEITTAFFHFDGEVEFE
ncbi:Carbonic anhydrase, beta class (EC [Olavius algarvensis Delta 1 endosymbiont]|nr:Carbonic anhydrase, beta class (EC [Olavius algarvensis Delta 1 endosymbiont]